MWFLALSSVSFVICFFFTLITVKSIFDLILQTIIFMERFILRNKGGLIVDCIEPLG